MIEFTRNADVWWAWLNRPDNANSLNAAMLQDLIDIIKAATAARAVIIAGTGTVFSAGGDMNEMRSDGLATSDLWERLSVAIVALLGQSIAALNDTLAGGAMGMALACDIRIAVPHANFLSRDAAGFYSIAQ